MATYTEIHLIWYAINVLLYARDIQNMETAIRYTSSDLILEKDKFPSYHAMIFINVIISQDTSIWGIKSLLGQVMRHVF